MVKVLETDQEIILSQIQVLPHYQNQGIGTAIIRDLQALARMKGVLLTLHALKNNRAIGLYKSLGFTISDDGSRAVTMTYNEALGDSVEEIAPAMSRRDN